MEKPGLLEFSDEEIVTGALGGVQQKKEHPGRQTEEEGSNKGGFQPISLHSAIGNKKSTVRSSKALVTLTYLSTIATHKHGVHEHTPMTRTRIHCCSFCRTNCSSCP
jgi:hypothetical protein